MSGIINSFLIEPVVRQARRFSGTNTASASPLPAGSYEETHPHTSRAVSTFAASPDDADPCLPAEVGNTLRHDDAKSLSSASSATWSGDEQAVAELQDMQNADAPDRDPMEQSQSEEEEAEEDEGDEREPQDSNRIPEVARENGLQGLIPMDDMRMDYVFDPPETVQSPPPMDVVEDVEEEGQGQAQALPLYGGVPVSNSPHNPTLSSLRSRSLDASMRSMSIDNEPQLLTATSRNPSQSAVNNLRNSVQRAGSSNSIRSRTSVDAASQTHGDERDTREAGSFELPEDDGMSTLRQKLHKIRDMALSTEEKAKRMHTLMMSDLKKFKEIATPSSRKLHRQEQEIGASNSGESPLSRIDGRKKTQSSASLFGASSNASTFDSIAHFNISAEDMKPTYQPRQVSGAEDETVVEEDDGDDSVDDLPLGCVHYKRNVKIQCADCRRWHTCRLCHDEVESHTLNRRKTKNMLCMLCGHPQPAAEYCRQCGELTAAYYCDLCKLWDNDATRSIYHCDDCGICRRGEGLGKDYIHCKKCNVCISIAWAPTHRCVERATECDCPICGEWMFTSSASVVAMRCGHYIHRSCYDAYMQVSYKCPMCSRSAVNMELQWRKLDRDIEAQPMPSQWQGTMVWVTCNDCATRCYTTYHWLGNKCTACDSYNTNEVKIVNSPSERGIPVDGQGIVEVGVPETVPPDTSSSQADEAMEDLETTIPSSSPSFAEHAQHVQDVGPIVPAYVNETATPHSPPQQAYHVEDGHHSQRDFQHRQNITFTAAGETDVNRAATTAAHTDEELKDITGAATPTSPSIQPANLPLPSSPPPPAEGYFTRPTLASDEDEDDDEEDEDDYDSEEEITFWGTMALSPSSWGMSMPSVSIPNMSMPHMSMPNMSMPNMSMPNVSMPNVNVPSFSLPSPISVGWAGSPRFLSNVWGTTSPSPLSNSTAAQDDNLVGGYRSVDKDDGRNGVNSRKNIEDEDGHGGVSIASDGSTRLPVGAAATAVASAAVASKLKDSRSVRSNESLLSGTSSGLSRFWRMSRSSTTDEDDELAEEEGDYEEESDSGSESSDDGRMRVDGDDDDDDQEEADDDGDGRGKEGARHALELELFGHR